MKSSSKEDGAAGWPLLRRSHGHFTELSCESPEAVAAIDEASFRRHCVVLAPRAPLRRGCTRSATVICYRCADPAVSVASTGIPARLTSDADAGHRATDRRRAGR